MVKDAPPLSAIGHAFGSPDVLIADYYVAHNAKFEREVMKAAGHDFKQPWLCTYKAALALWPDAPSHSNQALRYWLGLKLADDPGPPHRALGDAYVTAAIARRVLTAVPERASSVQETLEWWKAISAQPALLPRFRFGKHQGVPLAEVPTDYLEWVRNNVTDDEDVQYTARATLQQRREAARSRSPV
jgi:exodeoxyribonuclease X